ncbi:MULTISPECIES: hypothetical protein [unclassified Moraxella]|uniref:hypothetical protein n=1 Tax=unclassified Moraxella TaxID=2685852 RepID=UPI00359E797D
MKSQITPEITDKLQQLKELNEQSKVLQDELQGWLDDCCDDYLGAWLRACLETGKPLTLQALKESVINAERRANKDNVGLWHQLNEVKKLISVYELQTNNVFD